MKYSLLAFCGVASLLLTARSASAIGSCYEICTPSSYCDTPCVDPFRPYTGVLACGAGFQCGGLDPDRDHDGVPNNNDNCPDRYNPDQSCCGVFVLAAPTLLLCHLDPDFGISGIDVEIYTADRYEDLGCIGQATRFRKRHVTSVHCGFHSESTCGRRVQGRVEQLAGQGYIPITNDNNDHCPVPRI
jgi:hypothetical protein